MTHWVILPPYTTRAKILVQRLWDKDRGWDDPLLPDTILQEWNFWEVELQDLSNISLPRHHGLQSSTPRFFCNASERAYGSVVYLGCQDKHGQVSVSFLMAHSKVTLKRQLSMPRLELSGAQLADMQLSYIHRELTLPIQNTFLCSDSTTVLLPPGA